MKVFLLQHVSHLARHEFVGHRDEWGELLLEEDMGDSVTLLGCYSTQTRAEDRIKRAKLLPGFRDEPDCFIIDEHEVDMDEWTEGFVLVDTE